MNMWSLKLKIKHDCTIGSRCQKFGCTSYSLSLIAWRDKDFEYTSQKHQIFGPPQQVNSFLLDLRSDPRVFNLKTLNSQVYFIEKRERKEIPTSFYNPNLFFLKPVFVDIHGLETWELASRDKHYLEEFIKGLQGIKTAQVQVEYLKQYHLENSLEPLNKTEFVKRTEGELDQRLAEQLRIGHIEGDQWFRDFQEWLVIAFNNPYNYKHSNSELTILERNSQEIYPIIKDHLQVHYGVGVGETELEAVRWQLEGSNNLEVAAIDINDVFLELFLENLKNKQIEFPNSTILFKGFYTTFQNTTQDDFKFSNGKLKPKVHICLGGTTGNFRHQEEIWAIFNRNAEKGDKLLLGIQLNNHIDETFEKYKQNKYYPKFVLNYFDEQIDPTQIKWELEDKTGFILMNYKDIEVFRTRKYQLEQLEEELKRFDFSLKKSWVDEYSNSCISIFEKV